MSHLSFVGIFQILHILTIKSFLNLFLTHSRMRSLYRYPNICVSLWFTGYLVRRHVELADRFSLLTYCSLLIYCCSLTCWDHWQVDFADRSSWLTCGVHWQVRFADRLSSLAGWVHWHIEFADLLLFTDQLSVRTGWFCWQVEFINRLISLTGWVRWVIKFPDRLSSLTGWVHW